MKTATKTFPWQPSETADHKPAIAAAKTVPEFLSETYILFTAAIFCVPCGFAIINSLKDLIQNIFD